MSGTHWWYEQFRWPFMNLGGLFHGKPEYCMRIELDNGRRPYPPCVYTDDPLFQGHLDGCGKHGCSYKFAKILQDLARAMREEGSEKA